MSSLHLTMYLRMLRQRRIRRRRKGYPVFSCYDTTKDSDTYFTFSDDAAYDWYVNFAKTMSTQSVDNDNNADDTSSVAALGARNPILTLSTCEGTSGTPNRFVVHGVLTDIFLF